MHPSSPSLSETEKGPTDLPSLSTSMHSTPEPMPLPLPNFLPVAPLPVLAQLNAHGELADGLLTVANVVMADPFRYEAFFRRLREIGQGVDITLDNGLIEQGYALPPGVMMAAAQLLHAKTVVLPDVIANKKATLEASREAAKLYGEVHAEVTLMGVAQGRSLEEFVICGLELAKVADVLAVPRHSVARVGTRSEIIHQLYEGTGKPIHLLGFSDDVLDDLNCARMEGVTGIDSAMPIWFGLYGYPIEAYWGDPDINPEHRKRPLNYWGLGPIDDLVVENIRKVRTWLRGVTPVPTPEVHAEPAETSPVRSSSSEKPQVHSKSAKASRSSGHQGSFLKPRSSEQGQKSSRS